MLYGMKSTSNKNRPISPRNQRRLASKAEARAAGEKVMNKYAVAIKNLDEK